MLTFNHDEVIDFVPEENTMFGRKIVQMQGTKNNEIEVYTCT